LILLRLRFHLRASSTRSTSTVAPPIDPTTAPATEAVPGLLSAAGTGVADAEGDATGFSGPAIEEDSVSSVVGRIELEVINVDGSFELDVD